MEEHVLQAVGKVAGIGGLALGVFLLLFREVIRKNIFPKFSDDKAYRLIRLFMYLTFGIALCGIVAWTFLSASTAGWQRESGRAAKPSQPPADIAGIWTAEVKYAWGDTHRETFTFEQTGEEVSGTATFIAGAAPLMDGKIEGNRLSFRTVSYSEVSGTRYQEKHLYKGTVAGEEIQFVLETDSGYNVTPPIKFSAHKKNA